MGHEARENWRARPLYNYNREYRGGMNIEACMFVSTRKPSWSNGDARQQCEDPWQI